MQILSAALTVFLLAQQALAAPEPQYGYGYSKPRPPPCPADKCFSSIRLNKPVAKIASSFCTKYINYKATVTKSARTTVTSTVTSSVQVTQTPAETTATTIVTVTPPAVTESPTCSTATSTVQAEFTTAVFFPVRGQAPASQREKRAAPAIPAVLGAGCGSGRAYTSKISSACSCLLGTTKTVTSTSTKTTSVTQTATRITTAPAETTIVTATATASVPTITSCQTATSTTTIFAGGDRTCGAPVSTYGIQPSLTCDNVAPPGETNARLRVEGASEGNVFDGCIVSGPRNITTPSGGTHLCDGTNNNANPAPGSTFTTNIASAGMLEGFGFDGTYSNQFQDFFISSISTTGSTGSQFWGVLRNRVFTARGGCQEQNRPGDEALWAFDAFASNRVFLSLAPEIAVVRPGENVAVTVLATDPNSGNTVPASGATLGNGQVADASGNIQFTAPTQPGCYLYKAERTNAIRSATFYVAVAEDL